MANAARSGVSESVTSGTRSYNFKIEIGKMFDNTEIVNNDSENTANEFMEMVVDKMTKAMNELGLQGRLATQRI